MIISDRGLDSVVPLENASMPGRTVVQWDKDDCEDLGIIKRAAMWAVSGSSADVLSTVRKLNDPGVKPPKYKIKGAPKHFQMPRLPCHLTIGAGFTGSAAVAMGIVGGAGAYASTWPAFGVYTSTGVGWWTDAGVSAGAEVTYILGGPSTFNGDDGIWRVWWRVCCQHSRSHRRIWGIWRRCGNDDDGNHGIWSCNFHGGWLWPGWDGCKHGSSDWIRSRWKRIDDDFSSTCTCSGHGWTWWHHQSFGRCDWTEARPSRRGRERQRCRPQEPQRDSDPQ